MIQDVDAWIARRLDNRPVTSGLRDLIVEIVDAGFGWFEASPYRFEFSRSLPGDRWEVIIVWIRTTRTGRAGFSGAHHSITTIDARTRTAEEARAWATPREGAS